MKIVDRKTLAKMPNGTLYCGYTPDMLDGNFNVITGHDIRNTPCATLGKEGFYSVLPLLPSLREGEYKPEADRITNWCTVDTCDFDYDKNQLFAVFSKLEIRAMITVLEYALSDCAFPIGKFMDTYFYKDYEIDEKELEI